MTNTAQVSTPFLALVLVAAGFAASTSLRAEPPTLDDVAGSTWELASSKYGDATEWENVSGEQRKIKMLTATRFVWVSYESASGAPQSSGGGTYTLNGPTYTEVIEFGAGDMKAMRGKKQVFSLDLKGDRLEQTGQLSTGLKIAEVWQRVR